MTSISIPTIIITYEKSGCVTRPVWCSDGHPALSETACYKPSSPAVFVVQFQVLSDKGNQDKIRQVWLARVADSVYATTYTALYPHHPSYHHLNRH